MGLPVRSPISTASMIPLTQDKPVRAECVFLAKVAEEAERYQDVVTQITKIIDHIDPQLTIDERNLLSVAFKNITNALRNSWRAVDALDNKQATRASISALDFKRIRLLRKQREKIEKELASTCKNIVLILDGKLIPAAIAGEEKVFYFKMKGDYYRYLAEFAQKRDRDRFATFSLEAYKLAYKHAVATLDSLHPTRLGLALNFAVYYHDVQKSPIRACILAKSAFDDAVLSLDITDPVLGQTLLDSLMILQLLKDDMILWSAEISEDSK